MFLTLTKNKGSSETTRAISFFKDENDFNFWLAGLIDGDGYFGLSTMNYGCCEITLKSNEIITLHKIKSVIGGSVSARKGINAYRWRGHKKEVLLDVLNRVNGKLINPIRQAQFLKLCPIYGVLPIEFKPYSVDQTAWLTGFFEAEGCIHIRKYQLAFTLGQKDLSILNVIKNSFGFGNIYFDKSWNGYVWWVSAKPDLEKLLIYFNRFSPLTPLINANLITFRRILLFKERKYHLQPLNSSERKKIDNLIELYKKKRKKI
jgi:ubiquinol-cytochrome c reductase cytochrome b subunit